MKVAHVVSLTFVLGTLAVHIHGLDMNIDINTPEKYEKGVICGVLTCKETDVPAGSRITQLKVSKTTNTGAETGKPVKLSEKRQTISRKYLGFLVDGVLQDEQATLTLKMDKEEDCKAEYHCEVRIVDDKGFVHVRDTNEEGEHIDQSGSGTTDEGEEGDQSSLQQQINDLAESVDSKLDSFAEALLSVKTEVASRCNMEAVKTEILNAIEGQTGEISKLEQNNQNRFDKLTETVNENRKAIEQSNLNVQNQFSEVRNQLDSSFEQLKEEVKSSAAESLEGVCDLPCMANRETSNSTEPEPETKPVELPRCEKGMADTVDEDFPKYYVLPPGANSDLDVPFKCDSETDGGGWIVIQYRDTGEFDFFRGWEDYKNGFGDLNDEFWLGNKYIHQLTSSGKYELRVEVEFNEKSGFAHYASFAIGSEKENYKLILGAYDGTAGDRLTYHNGAPFSTKDRNNAKCHVNCPQLVHGAWWYQCCSHSNLNGSFNTSESPAARWHTLAGKASVTFSEMKIRRVGA